MKPRHPLFTEAVDPASPPPGGGNPPPAPPAPNPAPPPPAISSDGKLGENWFLALGDEFAPHAKDLSKHKDIRSIVQELDYFRKNGAEYPGADSKPEAVDRFRKIAGVPETPDGYGLTAEKMKLPEGMAFDSELAAKVAAAAHATHTPPAAVAAIAEAFNETITARAQAAADEAAKATAAAKDALVANWRGDFAANASTVRHLTNTLAQHAGLAADDPQIAELTNQPAFARMMFAMSKMMGEDRAHTPTGFGSLKSPAQQIADIQNGTDPVWGLKYTKGTREERVAAYEHVKHLHELASK